MWSVLSVAVVGGLMGAVAGGPVVPALGVNCHDPNNVREHLVAGTCNPNDPIQPITITVTDDKGNPNYPINVEVPIVINALSDDKTSGVIQKLDASVDLYTWNEKACDFSKSFFSYLLQHLDGCSIGHNCPLKPGKLTLHQSVDLSSFAPIIRVLASNEPYQLDIHLKDASTKKEVSCIRVQALIKKS